MLVAQLVEQPRRQHRHMMGVRAIEPKAVADRISARSVTCRFEIFCRGPALGFNEVQQHPDPQRGIGDDHPSRGGL